MKIFLYLRLMKKFLPALWLGKRNLSIKGLLLYNIHMIPKIFFKFFPVPSYMSADIAGLSISDNHIRLVSIKENKDGFYLDKYYEVTLEKGIVVSGDICRKDELILILESLRTRSGVSDVRVSIQEEKAYLFDLELPLVKRDEIKNTIEFKIEENVPLKSVDIVFDYLVTSKDDKSINTVVYAVPRATIEAYEEVLISSGFSPIAIEIESSAISRAVVSDNRSYLIAHFSKEKVGVCIVKNKAVHFTSTFPILSADDFSIPKEIKKVTHYFNDNYAKDKEKESLSEIIICGEIPDDNLSDQVFSEVGTATSVANPWVNIFDLDKYIPDMKKQESVRYVSSIGLAIPQDNITL